MTNDIREKAERLIQGIENCTDGIFAINIRNWQQFKDLKAALRPSKEEIAEWLERNTSGLTDPLNNYLKLAIEELRK